MRPRVFPAEDYPPRRRRPRNCGASMRPRVFPAEDVRSRHSCSRSTACFNEAAGIPRGRPARLVSSREDEDELQ